MTSLMSRTKPRERATAASAEAPPVAATEDGSEMGVSSTGERRARSSGTKENSEMDLIICRLDSGLTAGCGKWSDSWVGWVEV